MKRKMVYKNYLVSFILILLIAGNANAQNLTVSGTITEIKTGDPLPGVNVTLQGTTVGTVTNLEGKYTIEVPNANAVLIFSFVGYLTENVEIAGRTTIDIGLAEDIMSLEELVVIGYGTQKRSDLTGAISVVQTDDVIKSATNDVTKALQGQVAGVQVQGSGDPGAAPRVKIRGISTFGDNSPLYIIDGVFAPINDIPMEAIESIQVLKDASAAAIYGSRAANGVVIITTKRGQAGTMKVNYSGYYGWQDIVKRFDVCNREEYQMLANEATENAMALGTDPSLHIMPANDQTSPYYVDDIDTDWQNEVFKTGHINNHSLMFTGGNDISNFGVNLSYFDQTGTIVGKGPNYKRYGIGVNSDHKYGKFKIGESIHFTYADQTLMTFMHTGTLLAYTASAIPTIPVYDPNGPDGYGISDANIHGSYTANVVGMNNTIESNVDRYRFIGNVYGEYEIISGLKYKVSVSFEKTDWKDFHFEPEYQFGWFPGYTNVVAKMNDNRGIGYTGTFEQTLTYTKTLFEKLSLTALAGHSLLQSKQQRIFGHAEGFTEPYFKMLSKGETTQATSDEYESRLLSYFGRLILSYDDKYLLTTTLRRDYSSRFSSNFAYGNFPSVAVAWKMHNEPFLQASSIISQLKLRASYGVLGNQNIGDYLYQAYIDADAHYVLDNTLAQGASEFIPPSSGIKWEETKTTNFGIDLGLLNNKILVTAEYYIKNVNDLLGVVPLPTHFGWYDWEMPTTNALSVKNQGLELSAAYHKNEGDFNYSIGANLSTLKNEVTSLGRNIGENQNPILGTWSRTDIGHSVGEFYGYVVEKVFQEQSDIDALNAAAPDGLYQELYTAPGDFKYKDLNGDGEITDADRTYIGKAFPNIYYGFNFNASYMNFDLTIAAQGSAGNMINNAIGNALKSGAGLDNYHKDLLDRWTQENPNTGRPRIILDDPSHNGNPSAFWLEKGDYMKISNIELGYNFDKDLIGSIKVSSLRIYLSLQNAIVITKYSGLDPDFNNDGLFSRGTDNGAAANKAFTDFAGGLPTPRTIMIGVKAGF